MYWVNDFGKFNLIPSLLLVCETERESTYVSLKVCIEWIWPHFHVYSCFTYMQVALIIPQKQHWLYSITFTLYRKRSRTCVLHVYFGFLSCLITLMKGYAINLPLRQWVVLAITHYSIKGFGISIDGKWCVIILIYYTSFPINRCAEALT